MVGGEFGGVVDWAMGCSGGVWACYTKVDFRRAMVGGRVGALPEGVTVEGFTRQSAL